MRCVRLGRSLTPFTVALVLPLTALAGCGKKGPPLPPLVQLPAAPADLVASRRGSAVDIQFVIPTTNTDGSRPADIARVDVYGFTGPDSVTPDEVVREGSRIGSVAVNRPPDPDEEDAPAGAEPKPKPATGAEQGATVHVKDELGGAAGSPEGITRSYVGIGVNSRGRRGVFSKRAAVLVTAAPNPPGPPAITYDETRITVTWPPVPPSGSGSTFAYHVYETDPVDRRLTTAPLTEARFLDQRMEWGATHCYAVRSVETADDLSIESDASPATCVTLEDTFPPAAPTGLQAVSSQAAISLIWDASTEKDLAGYLVLRAVAPSTVLTPVTPAPIDATTFNDTVQAGVRASYAVQAVDKAGNVGPISTRVEETAR